MKKMKGHIKPVKQRYLHGVIKKFICTYIVDAQMYVKHFGNVDSLQEWEAYQQAQSVNEDGRYPCRSKGCKASFKYDGRSRRQHELSHNPPSEVREAPELAETRPNKRTFAKDDVFDYHCNLMNMSLLLHNFIDAGKEGDGDRLLRCIKMFMLHFRQDGSGSTKYALESLHHLFQVYVWLTPREAEHVKWNRTVSNKGGMGNNVFMDLDLEHDNHYFKEQLRSLGANVNQTSVNRISHAFFVTSNLLERLDDEMLIRKNSGEHTKKNIKGDCITVVKELVAEDVFTRKQDGNREMKVSHNCRRDYLQLLDTSSLFKWINDHKKNIIQGRRPR